MDVLPYLYFIYSWVLRRFSVLPPCTKGYSRNERPRLNVQYLLAHERRNIGKRGPEDSVT
jgi:hypothetical protein